ncbi:beta strand repeat-containing protein [Deinococcus knuensis]|nr:hypothetical protein [Deinococcus knuensis]
MTMNAWMPALLLLTLTLAACGGGGTPTPIGTPVTSLADSGAGSLRDTLAAAKSGDTLRLTGTGTLTLASPLSIDKNVTIIATGVTIDAAGKGRALDIAKGATVTMQGGTITGGTGGTVDTAIFTLAPAAATAGTWGGNLINSGTLTLDGVTIQNGQAFNGGGIFNVPGATLTLKNVTMTGNRATIPTPDLDNESTGSGGAIANLGTLTIDGGTFKNNSAVYSGGVIRQTGGTVTIKGGTFDSNTCTNPLAGCNGGVLIAAAGQTTITGGTFSKNSANPSGGGGVIRLGGTATVNIAGGTFSGNTAANGGAINTYNGGTLNISGGTFSGNTADNGGVINLYTDGTLKITGGTFEGNTATRYGGALTLSSTAKGFTMTGGTIRGNSATLAGGGINSDATMSLTGGVIEDNTTPGVGGGIATYAQSGTQPTVTLGGTLVIRNNRADRGGGVSIGSAAQGVSTHVIQGATIQGNTAQTAGGGISVGGVLKFSSGLISANTAVKGGGGLVVGDRGRVEMTGGSITGNTATNRIDGQDGSGGGVRLYAGASMTASGGTISNNVAWYGSGVKLDGPYQQSGRSTFVLSGATVSGNRADDNNVAGGFWNDGSLSITAGSVTGNTARVGAGVYNTRIGLYSQTGGSVSGNNPDNVYNVP